MRYREEPIRAIRNVVLGGLLVLVGLLGRSDPARAAQSLLVGHTTQGVDAFVIPPAPGGINQGGVAGGGYVIWSYVLANGQSLTLEQLVWQYYATSQAEAGCMVVHLWVKQPDGFFTSPWWTYAEWSQSGGDAWGIVASRPDFWNARHEAPRFTLYGPLTVSFQVVNCTSSQRLLYLGAVWTLGP